MRFAYADPPYPGKAAKHYRDHADYAGEVDHAQLIARLADEFPDGWALSTNSGELRWLLPLVPERHRILAWVKPFAMIKKHVDPTYAWEPVILCGGRNRFGDRERMVRDWIAVMPPIFRKRTDNPTIGEKPVEFCFWLFDCLGCEPDDELVDMFPGSGAVGRAWRQWSGRAPEEPNEQAAMAV